VKSLSIVSLPLSTLPFPVNPYRVLRKLRSLVSSKAYDPSHPSVTANLLSGLQSIDFSFNYNPSTLSQLSSNVHVIAGVPALLQMIHLRKLGFIRQLSVGPNVLVRATDFDNLLASESIDLLINHSKWSADVWLYDFPQLASKIRLWYCGVDTHHWSSSAYTDTSKNILFFDKSNSIIVSDRTSDYQDIVSSLGFNPVVLRRSPIHSYTPSLYHRLLNNSSLLVGFTVGSESQGLAWAEAWSCNVPTFVQRQNSFWSEQLGISSSTAPALTSATGLFFDNISDFASKFNSWLNRDISFSPRKWMLSNMDTTISAKSFLDVLGF
jgi:hypothetical protein